MAAQRGQNFNCARFLLDSGADILRQDIGGRTPVHTFYNDFTGHMLKNCIEVIDPWEQDMQGMTVMHFVCWSSKSSVRTISRFAAEPFRQQPPPEMSCLEIKDNLGRSVLHFASQRGNIELMRFLLTHPRAQKLMEPDYVGRSLLHYATESSRVHSIDLLLEHGLELDALDDEGRTVMHHAAMRNNLVAVKRLLDLGACPQLSLRGKGNKTPLELARAYRSYLVVEYLQTIYPKQESQEYDFSAFFQISSSGKPQNLSARWIIDRKHWLVFTVRTSSWWRSSLLMLIMFYIWGLKLGLNDGKRPGFAGSSTRSVGAS